MDYDILAILAAGAPEVAPFMADECIMAIPEMEGSIEYTTKDYLKYSQCIAEKAKILNEDSK